MVFVLQLLKSMFRQPSDDFIVVAEYNVNITTRCLSKAQFSSICGRGYNINFYIDSDSLSRIRTKARFNIRPLTLQTIVRKRKRGFLDKDRC